MCVIVQCCFSNGGHQFAAVQGNVIQVYSMVTYDLLVNLKGHNNRVRAVVWTDNDSEVISCGADGAVYEWNLATSRRVSENVIKQCQYNGVAVTKDMRSIVAVGSESIKEISDSQVDVCRDASSIFILSHFRVEVPINISVRIGKIEICNSQSRCRTIGLPGRYPVDTI